MPKRSWDEGEMGRSRAREIGLSQDPDSELDEPIMSSPQNNSEKRHIESLIFKEWARKRAEESTGDDVDKQLEHAREESLSTKELLARQNATLKITNPRTYQTELFETAKKQNTIAVLDTGSGKTHIATLLLRWTLDTELEDRASGKTHKTAFFLVNSVQLVFQQTNVLQCDLDQNVEGICGASGCNLWSREEWQKQLKNNMVIVCTAEVLLQCLMHSFTRIDLINLLIFDEAHHAKENHPYARIMREYYENVSESSEFPKIFGMTASPIDTKTNVKQAATLLERQLHSKIATTSDLALLRNHIHKPEEKVLTYGALLEPPDVAFSNHMKAQYSHLPDIKGLFEQSKKLSQELGRWCASAYWSFAFSEDSARRTEIRKSRKVTLNGLIASSSSSDDQSARYEQALKDVQLHNPGMPSASLCDLSPKVLKLHEYLRSYFLKPSDARCIVFVERRNTAHLLHMLFERIGGPNLRCGTIIGNRSGSGAFNVSTKQLVLTIAKFRKGELNCLFATSVAEEGLDIPMCNLVVRFDLYKTMIQYIQSKGRARHQNSVYLHMIEEGNLAQRSTCEHAVNSEKTMRNFCENLPSDRLIDEDPGNELDRERDYPTYIEPSTGAKLTYFSSLVVLEHFVSTLPREGNLENTVTYAVFPRSNKFVCEIIFPPKSPIRSIIGKSEDRKIIAKRSAAFIACLHLRKHGHLDENLLSTFTKKLPVFRNALLALDMNKKDAYKAKSKPDIWKEGRGERPEALYITVFDFSNGLDRPHQNIALLTRSKMPDLPSFPLWLNSGKGTNVVPNSFQTSVAISANEMIKINDFTLRVFHHLFHKTFERTVEKMSYWLAPVVDLSKFSKDISPLDLLDWKSIDETSAKEYHAWTPDMSEDFLVDKFLVDRGSGARRFYSLGINRNHSVLDRSQNSKGKVDETILEYTAGLGHKNKARWLKDGNRSQPVLKAEIVPFRRDFLASISRNEDETLKKEQMEYLICPEPLGISTLSTRLVASFYMFPSIVHRTESYLIALEACQLLNLNISPGLALEALTKDSDNTEDAQAEQINLRRGMGPNYERMEFLGDCFLKMATTISLFIQYPDDNEYDSHVKRMLMLCNKNLFNTALKLKIYEYIRTFAFSRRNWYPEGIELLEGRGATKKTDEDLTTHHSLGDKSIADVCEALIGAAFYQHSDPISLDGHLWDEAVKAVTVFVCSENHSMRSWMDYPRLYSPPKYQTAQANASQKDLADKIYNDMGYRFRWPRLLRSAFIHPDQAFVWEGIPNYQRLEFLGDSLLDMAIVSYIFYKYPGKDPQWLTEHKMPMVSNKFLGALCVKLKFHKHLRHNNPALHGAIQEYVCEAEEAERQCDGAQNYWTSLSDPPKCLADIVEAYVGAIFIDSNFDFKVVQQFFNAHIKWYFEDVTLYDSFANNHPAVRLHKLLDEYFCCREYRIRVLDTDAYLPGGKPTVTAMVMVHMKIIADATGTGRRYPKFRAIEKALEKIDGVSIGQFRERFGCDCPLEHEDAEGNGVEALAEDLL